MRSSITPQGQSPSRRSKSHQLVRAVLPWFIIRTISLWSKMAVSASEIGILFSLPVSTLSYHTLYVLKQDMTSVLPFCKTAGSYSSHMDPKEHPFYRSGYPASLFKYIYPLSSSPQGSKECMVLCVPWCDMQIGDGDIRQPMFETNKIS